MWRSWSAVEISVAFGIGGTLLAIAVPAFLRNLHASKLSEAVDGLDRLVTNAVTYAEDKPQEISFPPSAPLTPAEVPRGVRTADPEGAWEHLTWRSLRFRMEGPHAFAFQFDSAADATTQVMTFTATAHGDLDGDGTWSTFEVRGERRPGQPARIVPGMYVEREVE
jgi:hypothetical protein